MKKHTDILKVIKVIKQSGTLTFTQVKGIVFDSREVYVDTVFVAIKGEQSDGHSYIDQAISSGASLIIVEDLPFTLNDNVCYLQVASSNEALAHLASWWYDNPSRELTLVGVTGTNGKTTIATLLYQLFCNADFKTGLLSTVEIKVAQQSYKATHTTPDSMTINKYLRLMLDAGVTHCFMEVSSHGIDQHRTTALDFNGGIFTNLSHDHLDYHKSFKDYRDVKKRFFDQMSSTAFAITNIDDRNGAFMLQNTKASTYSYALDTLADYHTQIIESTLEGLWLRINGKEVSVPLIGRFNACNLTAIYATARQLGIDQDQVLQQLSILSNVSGRFQYYCSPTKKTIAIVDYAHTPDALENVLKTIQDIKTEQQHLVTVVGCGGNRDKTKRPIMAKIACQYSDTVVLTSDNPRFEEPQAILDDMLQGVPSYFSQDKFQVVIDRKQAIVDSCKEALSSTILLVAGKGHETYQEVKGQRTYFNDMEILQKNL